MLLDFDMKKATGATASMFVLFTALLRRQVGVDQSGQTDQR
jgi:hypothetical protein